MVSLTHDDFVRGVRAGDRAVLARAITLVESERPEHRTLAQKVVGSLLPLSGGAQRIGISGVPGAGKSTWIDAVGSRLAKQQRVAVLAVDPSSSVTGGSILGDKTRMGRLANEPNAYIRPSPTGQTLGGVAKKTREAILLCEAAGFDIVIVETVGVGQSETLVSGMVDFFLVLTISGAGDELQGIKRGILEIADLVVVNKADGENVSRAERAQRDLQSALRLMRGSRENPNGTPVMTCSARTEAGLDEVWLHVEQRLDELATSGQLETNRQDQNVRWMWSQVETHLMHALRTHPTVIQRAPTVEAEVRAGTRSASTAATELVDDFLQEPISTEH